jgi:hypothetical protein
MLKETYNGECENFNNKKRTKCLVLVKKIRIGKMKMHEDEENLNIITGRIVKKRIVTKSHHKYVQGGSDKYGTLSMLHNRNKK